MTHKLNIKLVEEIKKPEPSGPPALGGPVGWWIVETEGETKRVAALTRLEPSLGMSQTLPSISLISSFTS